MGKRLTAKLSHQESGIEGISLSYYVLQKPYEGDAVYTNPVYGIGIESIDAEAQVDYQGFHDVCLTEEKMLSFIDTLKCNTVTPVALDGLIDDWLAEQYAVLN